MNRIKNLKQYPSSPGTLPTLENLKQRATSGRAADVDFLMENLDQSRTHSHCKVIDFALSLVSSTEGQARIGHFLFNGSQVQRNYAALYFKRRGDAHVIDEAVQRGCIDEIQGYST